MRFFVEGSHAVGEEIPLTGADARKILTVLRMRSGDRIELIASGARRFSAQLQIDGRDVLARLLEELPEMPGSPLHVTIAQGIPKAQKMDFVVEKLTELGVGEIVPLRTERSIADAGEHKLERWRRLAKTAAQQCNRSDVPAVHDAMDFATLVQRFAEYDLVLFPWELAPKEELREALPLALRSARHVLALIGPEGGFSHAEAEAAQEAGARWISLGPRILRTETAGLVLLAIMNFLTEG